MNLNLSLVMCQIDESLRSSNDQYLSNRWKYVLGSLSKTSIKNEESTNIKAQ